MSFSKVFSVLKSVLAEYSEGLQVTTDTGEIYSLDTRHIMKNGKPLFFASAVINKSYLSFHLMPVYVFPELLDDMSPELKARMQGKSCFNFKSIDDELVVELKSLTRSGYEIYKSAGYV